MCCLLSREYVWSPRRGMGAHGQSQLAPAWRVINRMAPPDALVAASQILSFASCGDRMATEGERRNAETRRHCDARQRRRICCSLSAAISVGDRCCSIISKVASARTHSKTQRTDDVTLVVAARGRTLIQLAKFNLWHTAVHDAGASGLTEDCDTTRMLWQALDSGNLSNRRTSICLRCS